MIKWNERAWAGQIVSWIKSAIENGTTVFQDVSNDSSLKLDSGRTKYPDILLFVDKVSGVVFNGWELKFPDTAVDDPEMLENALEKARKLQSDSLVTWNGPETVIWGIKDKDYSIASLTRLKEYDRIATINAREDISDYSGYTAHEEVLKKRLEDILHDLEQLYQKGTISPALDISGNIIGSVNRASIVIIPQFKEAIVKANADMPPFRADFNRWKVYESSTLKILKTSSRRVERVDESEVLAKFMFYNLVGKILFYLTLCENLSGRLPKMSFTGDNAQELLDKCFDKAKEVDYQAIFRPYFTDGIKFSDIVNEALLQLIKNLTEFDFKILPSQVIGNVLENLVPRNEKQKFGQYFTPEILAELVAFPAVQRRDAAVFDPTSGTGTFLSAFYHIFNYYGYKDHSGLLNKIWGNDVSHFPAILSVINLYKQDVTQVDNFPRIMREDFFNIRPGMSIEFPDSHDDFRRKAVDVPEFDGIAGNFPFIQQEDIPNKALTLLFRDIFQNDFAAFIKDGAFYINERSDYFTYCVYQSYRFLKDGGILSCITSNAWLGKEYGIQFKRFLLDNCHIKYIVKSGVEHWFSDSQVSTVYFVIEKRPSDGPTRFVTINRKLKEAFGGDDEMSRIKRIDDFYREIDFCDDPHNDAWTRDRNFKNLYSSADGALICNIVTKAKLEESLKTLENWDTYFISDELFDSFDKSLTYYGAGVADVIRGERTGWNPMFIIPQKNMAVTHIAPKYLVPYIKSPVELSRIAFADSYKYGIFCCNDNIDDIDAGTKSWIARYVNVKNKNGTQTIPQACAGHKPYWYSLNPKKADIFTAINPYKRYFFSYTETGGVIDQRLIGFKVTSDYDVELIAALLNSAITFLLLEMRGTSRNLGALDLNANYLKKMRFLNPDLLFDEAKESVVNAFRRVASREILDFVDEIKLADRIDFDRAVLKGFGYDPNLLSSIYGVLTGAIEERVNMKNNK